MQASFAEFLVAAIVMEITPGPNMTWLALLSAREGRMAGLQAVAGIATGLTLLAVIAATGAAALISAWPPVYEALRWAGVIFLLYLAWETWVGEKQTGKPREPGKHFWRGLVVNLLNPKAAAVFIVMIPGFAGPAPSAALLLGMTLTYLAIATFAHVLIAAFASNFQKAMANPKREVLVRRIFAVALAAVAIWFALTSGQRS